MNYIHVHEKCLKCGECRLECEHRTKWTSSSTSVASSTVQPPNTESDKSIDEIIEAYIGSLWETLGSPKKYKEANTSFKSDIYSLLMDVIGGDSKFRKPEDELDRGVQIGYDACRVEIRQRLSELFNVKEK